MLEDKCYTFSNVQTGNDLTGVGSSVAAADTGKRRGDGERRKQAGCCAGSRFLAQVFSAVEQIVA